MRRFKVGFIGTGGRSVIYARSYARSGQVDVVALADPQAEHRKVMAAKAGLEGGFAEYDDWREMLGSQRELDGVVICTPNHVHADPAVACLERGLPVAIEKPLSNTKCDCERILHAERANNGRTLIGFVLRWTPMYSRIHQLITEGAIGPVVSIQADELPGLGVTSIMTRSPWRRFQAASGGSMLEKCCHDMDILNWMMGCRAVSLNSYGGVRVFQPDASLPAECRQCPPDRRCQYYIKPPLSAHEDDSEQVLQDFIRQDGLCIHNIDKDVADVQSVGIEYESGAVANFMMNFNCMGPRAGRNFHAIGQKGRIWGNLSEKKVFLHDNVAGKTSEFDASGDGSGHGGGDRLHALTLLKMMAEPDYRPDCGATAGYLSAVMCFAADASRTERRRVELRHRDDGHVEIL